MQTVGVLLVTHHSDIFTGIVRSILEDAPTLSLWAELTPDGDVTDALDRTRAQAVVWLVDDGSTCCSHAVEVLRKHQRVCVLTVQAADGVGMLWRREPLGRLSAERLIGALAGSGSRACQ
jgi:hypothetical protein